MFQNAKITYEAEHFQHVLSVPRDEALIKKLWELAETRQLRIRHVDNPVLFDGEIHIERPWLNIMADRGTYIFTEDDALKIAVVAQYDALDGTNGQPTDLEHAWMYFVPICVDLMKIAGESR